MTVNLTRIYTKLGDDGETHLGDMSRVPKTHPRIEAYGEIDELNSHLGVARAMDLPEGWAAWLTHIQNDLFDVGADLSVPPSRRPGTACGCARADRWLEERCDEVNARCRRCGRSCCPAAARSPPSSTSAGRSAGAPSAGSSPSRTPTPRCAGTSTGCRTCSSSSPAARTPRRAPSRSGSPGASSERRAGAAADPDAAARRGRRRRRPGPAGRARQARGALGRLEELAIWLAGTSGAPRPQVRARVVVAAADHGVAAAGVSAYPPSVTAQMLEAFVGGGAAVGALARQAGADLVCVDAGVREPGPRARAAPGSMLVRTGLPPSRDLSREPALDVGEVALAVDTGRALAAAAAREGITVLVGGEMGIGNTTPATCLAAWVTGSRDPAALTGPGTGVDAAGLERKRAVVAAALALHGPQIRGPLGALRRLGGGELAVLCGLALGAGEHGLAYVCDGLIATAAAAVAAGVEPGLRPRLLAGHRSPEPAHDALLAHLGLEPVLDLGMRLGEGSGAVCALAILRLACAAHDGMASFAEAGVAGPAA
jgi:nicotinate-nucleotide--dimethylbenzimidazole phosphoribosyltransferase